MLSNGIAMFRVFVAECFTEIVVTETGFLTSPNYPNPYPPSLECLWVLRADVGATVRLTMLDFDLEESNDCQFDVFVVGRLLIRLPCHG